MTIYLNGERVKLKLGNISYKLVIGPTESNSSDNFIRSSDGYILRDINELYLIPKEDN